MTARTGRGGTGCTAYRIGGGAGGVGEGYLETGTDFEPWRWWRPVSGLGEGCLWPLLPPLAAPEMFLEE